MRGNPISTRFVSRTRLGDDFGSRLARDDRGSACDDTSGAERGT
jgi:hypothetical protein